jgi:S1-C subfamily serine protease
MDETTLRTLMECALAGEPPIGRVADNALRAGIKVRRRRVFSAAGSMAAAAALAVAIPVVAGPLGAPPASRQHPASTLPFSGSANVPPPDKSVLRWPTLAKDRASVVKITGDAATTCYRSMEVAGFVISPQHVLTNAHSVAGMTRLHVVYSTHNVLPAKVVLFDSNTDVAILYVPHLNAPPLRFTGPAPQGSDAVVATYVVARASYPPDGRFQAVPARVGSRWSAQGPNIYHTGTVTRAIYRVRAMMKPPGVGGPLLAKNGKVYGLIFAGSTTARDTWFALTASAIGPDVRRGARATTPVSTQGCPPPPAVASPSPAPNSSP